ncbi:MAG: methylmalonyl Co-A mutase-associated GTPase MeaB [Balneolales bacterium]|nr:methylmalonyl Co-A mutase-associated GTPase MeaB [Balneolales bacterium]
MTITELAEGIRAGKRRHLAKAITLVESNKDSDRDKATQLLASLEVVDTSVRVGISGVPGVGKSTFIEALGMYLIEKGHKVAVLAVDPSSPTSGGSILGDKTRMEALSTNDQAFIRPSPTSGTLGGVTKTTRESMLLCEAAGFDVILVETVGVGQSEFEVASMVDCFLVMMLPGAGDSLQGIKRGILEITDIMVINKADGDQEKLALRAKTEYEHAFQFLQPKFENIQVQFLAISALERRGISDTWNRVETFISRLKENGLFGSQRTNQNLSWFNRLTEDAILTELWKDSENQVRAKELREKIEKNEISPLAASREMISKMQKP